MRNNIQSSKTEYSFIASQLSPSVSQLTYGRANRTVDKVGCGILAVYNALVCYGEPRAFSELLAMMERLRMPWLFGFFGTKPFCLSKLCRRLNIPFRKYYSAKHFANDLTHAHAGIVCSWNPRLNGIHFYCVYYSENEKCIYSLNYYQQSTPAVISPSVFVQRRWIVGYLI